MGSGSAQSTATHFPHSINRPGMHFLRANAAARCDSYSMKAKPLFFLLSTIELKQLENRLLLTIIKKLKIFKNYL
jgi:hypothetical protein